MKALSVCVVMFLLTGCAVAPDYEPIKVEKALVDKEWHSTLPHGGKITDLTHWWAQFDDPAMTRLIEHAEASSPTLDAALARVNQARASARKSDADLFPSVTGSASNTRRQSAAIGGTNVQTVNTASLDALWELDLFGGKRRGVEQSEAQLGANEARWHDARVTLAAEIARDYVDYRACEKTAKLYERRLASQTSTEKLVYYKVKSGLSATTEGDLSKASMLNVASMFEQQKGVCAQKLNLLAQMTTLPITELRNILASASARVPVPREADILNVPAVTIEQRPDIAVAERNLAAASAAIGVAEASRYPSLSLTGSIGLNQTSGSSTLSIWSFGPALSLPIFNAGALEAEADRTRAAYDEARATYRETVLKAVREVEDALTRLEAINSRMKQTEASVEYYHRYLETTEISYKSGTTSLLDLEETRRTVYSAEQSLIEAQQEQADTWIALYKAVGGGWASSSYNKGSAP